MSEIINSEHQEVPELSINLTNAISLLEARINAKIEALEAKVSGISWMHDELLAHHIRLAQARQLLDNPEMRAAMTTQINGDRR